MVQAEEFRLALEHLHVVLVVDVEAVLGQGPDLLLHDQCLLAVDAEGGDDAQSMGQWREHNRPGTVMRHDG